MKAGQMKPVITVRVANESVFFGPGVMMILEALESHGTMKDACRETGISYSKAWRILNQVEDQLGYPVVSRKHGGHSGGGCEVTPGGRELMRNYRQAEKRIKDYAGRVFEEIFPSIRTEVHQSVSSLAGALRISQGDIISLTGAGGKTSCLYRLGEELKESGILLTTTTKMGYPSEGRVDGIYSADEYPSQRMDDYKGRIFLYGQQLDNNKCGHAPIEMIKTLSPYYYATVIEADGSRQLPLKGYYETEPCIPDFASINVGIATVQGIGRQADESWILRWPEFQRMAGIKYGEKVNETHMAKWIAHPGGMFKGSCGQKVLFWNQIEQESQMEQVMKVIELLDQNFKSQLFRIIAGSIFNSEYQVIWQPEEENDDVCVKG